MHVEINRTSTRVLVRIVNGDKEIMFSTHRIKDVEDAVWSAGQLADVLGCEVNNQAGQ